MSSPLAKYLLSDIVSQKDVSISFLFLILETRVVSDSTHFLEAELFSLLLRLKPQVNNVKGLG